MLRAAFFGLAVLLFGAAQAVPVHQFNTSSGIGPETVENFAGYIAVNNTRNLFYWFFESRGNPSTDPFILWYRPSDCVYPSLRSA